MVANRDPKREQRLGRRRTRSCWGFLNDAVIQGDPVPGFSCHTNVTFPFSHSAATVYMLRRSQRRRSGLHFSSMVTPV